MVAVYVDVDLDDFNDEDLKDELESRGFTVYEDPADGGWDELVQLNKAYQLHHDGKKDLAYEILWEMCLERLNKVV